MNYITWALIGMVGYSFTTFLVKFATRSGQFSSFLVLAIASVIVFASAVCITVFRGDLQRVNAKDFLSPSAGFAYATGIALTIADGYHRICAICYSDESAPIPCRTAALGR